MSLGCNHCIALHSKKYVCMGAGWYLEWFAQFAHRWEELGGCGRRWQEMEGKREGIRSLRKGITSWEDAERARAQVAGAGEMQGGCARRFPTGGWSQEARGRVFAAWAQVAVARGGQGRHAQLACG